MVDTIQFGQHLTLDGYGGDPDILDDKDVIFRVLNELPGKLGMKKMGEPVIRHTEGNDLKDPGGWTGIVLIEESHISIHTFAKRKFISADVYTCTDKFDTDFTIKYFEDVFKLTDVETNHILRGSRYPKENLV